MEKIRKLVDMTICKESKISYAYPQNYIVFPPNSFNSLKIISYYDQGCFY